MRTIYSSSALSFRDSRAGLRGFPVGSDDTALPGVFGRTTYTPVASLHTASLGNSGSAPTPMDSQSRVAPSLEATLLSVSRPLVAAPSRSPTTPAHKAVCPPG